jgi:hypothetical protein
MIVKEFYRTRSDGVNLYKTYSDLGVFICKEGKTFKYREAIDVENANFTYVETDIKIVEASPLKNVVEEEK